MHVLTIEVGSMTASDNKNSHFECSSFFFFYLLVRLSTLVFIAAGHKTQVAPFLLTQTIKKKHFILTKHFY